jgi:hypothetical protein
MDEEKHQEPTITQTKGSSLTMDGPLPFSIKQEWELHTCKRGHTWRFLKPNDRLRCDLVSFTWTGADGSVQHLGSGSLCMQCLLADLVVAYGPVKTEPAPEPERG